MFKVFGFYKFVKIRSLKNNKDFLQKFLILKNIRGTIIIAKEGLNGTVSGQVKDINETIKKLRSLFLFKKFDNSNESKSNFQLFHKSKVKIKKEIVDESFPGDIVGLHDTGNFKIGDTLTEGEKLNFKGIPSFSPEHFRYVNNADPMKSKQLFKGLDQLMDEGVAQLFTLDMNGRKIIGTVGALQYEVIQYRLEHEYGAKCSYENINVHKACWVEAEDPKNEEFKEFKRVKQRYLAKDKQGQMVFLADSAFTIQMTQSKYPTVKLHFTSEFQ